MTHVRSHRPLVRTNALMWWWSLAATGALFCAHDGSLGTDVPLRPGGHAVLTAKPCAMPLDMASRTTGSPLMMGNSALELDHTVSPLSCMGTPHNGKRSPQNDTISPRHNKRSAQYDMSAPPCVLNAPQHTMIPAQHDLIFPPCNMISPLCDLISPQCNMIGPPRSLSGKGARYRRPTHPSLAVGPAPHGAEREELMRSGHDRGPPLCGYARGPPATARHPRDRGSQVPSTTRTIISCGVTRHVQW
jgi:hypothetical protein